MRRSLAGVIAGASLLGLAGAALGDGYSAPRGYDRPFSWTGFYVGVQGGAGWGTSDDSLASFQQCIGGGCGPLLAVPAGILRDSYTINGFHGGGTLGYNLQTGPVVIGVEGDISAADIKGDGNCDGSFAFGLLDNRTSCHTRLSWFGTLSGRLGLAVDHALFFAKAGVAWGGFDRGVSSTFFAPGGLGSPFASASVSETRTGFVLGTGIEYGLRGGWSAKLEYDFMDFGTKREDFAFRLDPTNVIHVVSNDREQVHVVRLGLNYRFGDDRYYGPLK